MKSLSEALGYGGTLALLLLTTSVVTTPIGRAQSEAPIHFEKQVLTHEFLSEGVAVADVNRDDVPDVIAGAYWFEGPAWTPHEISQPVSYDPATEYSDTFLNFALDVNLDGWVDVIRVAWPGAPGYWLENPGPEDRHWTSYLINESIANESPRLEDIDGDGRPDLVCGHHDKRQMAWFKAPTVPGDTTWTRYPISEPGVEVPGTDRYSHGLGVGDVNQDGRQDVLIKEGWWEAPADPRTPSWTFHEAALGGDASQMYVYDVDKDGDHDVLSASAHNYGIWWHEQKTAEDDTSSWATHLIYDQFSQTHGLAFVDLNADGHPDLVTGKRYFAHNGKDPGGLDPVVLYWFEFRPDGPGGPTWVPHQIDDDSGIGEHLAIEDLNGDGLLDIAVSNKKGVFVFRQQAD